jgi:glycosyltransferase involved in cell wall biosynthesis
MKTILVIPCFNEEKRLDFIPFERAIAEGVSFCFVNDGSTDKTDAVLHQFSDKHPRQAYVVSLEHNQGKAAAVREGMLYCSGLEGYAYIGYWDADLAAPLTELPRLQKVFQEKPDMRIVMASRVRLLGYNIQRKMLRHYIGRVFATAASILLGISVYDTQCGAKLFRQDIVLDIFKAKLRTAWIFDVEVLLRATFVLGGKENIEQYINEVPLRSCFDVDGSKIKLIHYLKAMRDFGVLILEKGQCIYYLLKSRRHHH